MAALPALMILAGLTPTTWLLPSRVGYFLSGAFVCGVLVVGLWADGFPRRMSWVAVILCVYWILLIVQYLSTGTDTFVPYLLLTPLAIASLVIVAPRLIARKPTVFAATLALLVFSLSLVGFGLLFAHYRYGVDAPYLGRPVQETYMLRTASVYGNSNHFGFAALLGTLSGLYLTLETRRWSWAGVTVVLAVALGLADSRSAIVAGVLGAVILFGAADRRVGAVVSAVVVAGSGVVYTSPTFDAALASAADRLAGRIELWRQTWRAATVDPVIGAGFSTNIRVHNTYLGVLLHAGFVAGGVYLLAIAAALVVGAVRATSGELWDAYTFATLVAICLHLVAETSTIGGLTTGGLALALYLGLVTDAWGVDVPIRRLRRIRRALLDRNRTRS